MSAKLGGGVGGEVGSFKLRRPNYIKRNSNRNRYEIIVSLKSIYENICLFDRFIALNQKIRRN